MKRNTKLTGRQPCQSDIPSLGPKSQDIKADQPRSQDSPGSRSTSEGLSLYRHSLFGIHALGFLCVSTGIYAVYAGQVSHTTMALAGMNITSDTAGVPLIVVGILVSVFGPIQLLKLWSRIPG